jgi:alpha-N-arabinofuranosidase
MDNQDILTLYFPTYFQNYYTQYLMKPNFLLSNIMRSATVILTLIGSNSLAQTAQLSLSVDNATRKVSPTLYGLMTEEINHSYDGGLYAELIRNRIFKDNVERPEAWDFMGLQDAKGGIKLVGKNPLNVPKNETGNQINDALTTCLMLNVDNAGQGAGVSNSGFWGIAVLPDLAYNGSFYAKSDAKKDQVLDVMLIGNDNQQIFAKSEVTIKAGGWKKYSFSFRTDKAVAKTKDAKFVILAHNPGNYFFNLVSLFPPTYKNRANGNRADIMQMLADLHPTFLRMPGGNFLEGDYFNTRFKWQETLGPLEQRPGHQGCWGYRASDGLGLLEFLEWCEDLNIEPLLAVYAGYSLAGDHIEPGNLLEPYVKDALDEIEYVTGSVHTRWGAVRAKDGHPAPFKLKYIEIGNEDWFDPSPSYDGRFTQFKKAINSKYPDLKCISTIEERRPTKVVSSRPDMIDEHYYRDAWQMEEDVEHYDKYDRKSSPQIFVGEWATREGAPTTNMNAALGDAAWMTGMERNSDIVIKSCYAPLLVNVNEASKEFPKGWQWDSDLIGYNALSVYAAPSYYVQQMFATHLGDKVVMIKSLDIPTKHSTKKDSINTWESAKKSIIPVLSYGCTKDTKKGVLYLKIINSSSQSVPLRINITTKHTIASTGELLQLKSDKPEDTNDIEHPKNIIPHKMIVKDIKPEFDQKIAPYSVNVYTIKLNAKN